MDTKLIERLAYEASLWPALVLPTAPGAIPQADADSQNANLLAQWSRFASLVAHECAAEAERFRIEGCYSFDMVTGGIADRIRERFPRPR